ncbi:MAG: hypothetical protein AAFN50_10310 [Pseudomonadota bacterium]
MTLWIIFGALLVLALAFVVWPLFRSRGRLTPMLAGVIVVVVGVSAGLYQQIGSPGVKSGAAEQPDVNAMIAQLEARLQREPENVEGWLLMARSYQTLEQFDKAAVAYERVLELAPMQPTALFYGGYIAAARGELSLAADRWEAIMRVAAPPEDVRESMQRQITVWRSGTSAPAIDSAPAESSGTVVTASITLSNEAASTLPAGATLFVIARDPAQPSPPIAVARRVLDADPMVVELGDRDAMVPGRTLSAFARFEVVARVSLSGNAIAQPGDWFGGQLFTKGDEPTVSIVIDTPVE